MLIIWMSLVSKRRCRNLECQPAEKTEGKLLYIFILLVKNKKNYNFYDILNVKIVTFVMIF